ncbi:hypothetical protein Ahy_B09g094565 isoform B [Arachis hypogaea]|uniref:Uncharacterized protein n=1 Tax=Arachis hypogaea TaxID=3818 RepID=A0A444XBN9_ARAHY|nr:hypothetical protein Ahy_B09g094565 isoform B [Arachis hypogaea]
MNCLSVNYHKVETQIKFYCVVFMTVRLNIAIFSRSFSSKQLYFLRELDCVVTGNKTTKESKNLDALETSLFCDSPAMRAAANLSSSARAPLSLQQQDQLEGNV